MNTEPSVTPASRYSTRRTARNSSLSAAQVVTVGLTLLLAYRLALTDVTREEFGLYATMFACGTLTQLGTLGFAGGAPRHMARTVGEGSVAGRLQVVFSSLGVSFVGSLVVAALLLVGLAHYSTTLDPHLADVAGRLTPVIVAAALVTPVSTAIQGLTDGLGQTHVRSLTVIAASLVFYAVVAVTLPDQGVVSLAWAALVQQGLVLLVLLVVVLRECDLSRSSWSWSRARWREMKSFNLKFQAMTLPALAFEPLAKLLLSAFAGFSAVATFEIANRLLQQVNAVILAANQAVVPLVAYRSASGDLQDAVVFRRLFQAVWTLALTAFAAALIVLVPLGTFVFETSDPALVGYGLVLCLGWLANALCGPAYFISVTTDSFRANIVANYLMVATLALGGAVLGSAFGGIGIALAVALGLATAGLVINGSFMRRHRLAWAGVLTGRDVGFAVLAAVLAGAVLAIASRADSWALPAALVALVLLGVAGLLQFRHGPVWPVLTRREA